MPTSRRSLPLSSIRGDALAFVPIAARLKSRHSLPDSSDVRFATKSSTTKHLPTLELTEEPGESRKPGHYTCLYRNLVFIRPNLANTMVETS